MAVAWIGEAVQGTEEGVVMLTCEGKPIGIADLAAAYRRVCATEAKLKARQLKKTKKYVWQVIRGERKSPRIEAWLKKNMRRMG
jgi:hypothetical protein